MIHIHYSNFDQTVSVTRPAPKSRVVLEMGHVEVFAGSPLGKRSRSSRVLFKEAPSEQGKVNVWAIFNLADRPSERGP